MPKAQSASLGTLGESSAWVGDVVEGQLALGNIVATRKAGRDTAASKASVLSNVVSGVFVDAVKSLVELDAELKNSGKVKAIYLSVEAHGNEPDISINIKSHALCLLLSSPQ